MAMVTAIMAVRNTMVVITKTNTNKIGVIIQARMSSSRLPKKVLRDFSSGKTILEILVNKLRNIDLPIIIATSTSEADNEILDFGRKHGIRVFQGDEEDVLKRFVDAATTHGFESIVRICADNPFLDFNYLKELIQSFGSSSNDVDYMSFQDESGTPSIKTHWGVFAEIVTLKALRRALAMTEERLYHEHVTNFIYGHPHLFRVVLLMAPHFISKQKDLRFTVDTELDFKVLGEIYNEVGESLNLEELISHVVHKGNVIESMKRAIFMNQK